MYGRLIEHLGSSLSTSVFCLGFNISLATLRIWSCLYSLALERLRSLCICYLDIRECLWKIYALLEREHMTLFLTLYRSTNRAMQSWSFLSMWPRESFSISAWSYRKNYLLALNETGLKVVSSPPPFEQGLNEPTTWPSLEAMKIKVDSNRLLSCLKY